MKISYVEIDEKSPLNVHEAHVHDECEIYINISGNVSFSVEDSVYPLLPGNIIITRPYEYHHCVYHSNDIHKHFWILFSARGNESLFDLFYNRESGRGNMIRLDASQTEKLVDTCKKLLNSDSETEKYYLFFKIINLMSKSKVSDVDNAIKNECVTRALNIINAADTCALSVSELAKKCFTSVNTLERNFKAQLNILPSEYIKKKKLIYATKLLKDGYCVTEAAERSGFSDCSNFIYTFKKYYNMTPLKYKKYVNSEKIKGL